MLLIENLSEMLELNQKHSDSISPSENAGALSVWFYINLLKQAIETRLI